MQKVFGNINVNIWLVCLIQFSIVKPLGQFFVRSYTFPNRREGLVGLQKSNKLSISLGTLPTLAVVL